MAMMGSLTNSALRSPLAASVLLATFATAPARAASFTVFWDQADFGFGPGIGVSQATAFAARDNGGIPIISTPPLQPWDSEEVPVIHDAIESSLVLPPSGNATITADWKTTNEVPGLNDGNVNNGNENQQLFLIYAQPVAHVDAQGRTVDYAASDVGLTLTNGQGGFDWFIIETIDSSSIPLYFPAVSLGILANGATADFDLFYTLKNPQDQVFQGTNTELGMPKWNLAFVTAVPIPEPSSGLLMFIGLLGLARSRRKHS